MTPFDLAATLSTTDVYHGNPVLETLALMVDSYDEETQKVSLVAIKTARIVLSGRIPPWWIEEQHD